MISDEAKRKNAQINSAPHPELWPAPLTPEGAVSEGTATVQVDPVSPRVNAEYLIKVSGLPVSSGLTWHLTGSEPETWLTHKSDPHGIAHVVWRTANAGTVNLEIFSREWAKTGARLVETSFQILPVRKSSRAFV